MDFKELQKLVEEQINEGTPEEDIRIQNAVAGARKGIEWYFRRAPERMVTATELWREGYPLIMARKYVADYGGEKIDYYEAWNELVEGGYLWMHNHKGDSVYSWAGTQGERAELEAALEPEIEAGEINPPKTAPGAEDIPDLKGAERLKTEPVVPEVEPEPEPLEPEVEAEETSFSDRKEIMEDLTAEEGVRGGVKYRKWSVGGRAVELCACPEFSGNKCPQFFKLDAEERYVAVVDEEAEQCEKDRDGVISTIADRLGRLAEKKNRAVTILEYGTAKKKAELKKLGYENATALTTWLGELGELAGVYELLELGADVALLPGSAQKNDAVFFSPGKKRKLAVGAVSIKTSTGTQVNGMGASSKPDFAQTLGDAEHQVRKLKFGNKHYTVNLDHFLGSMLQIRQKFYSILSRGGPVKAVDKRAFEITQDTIGYFDVPRVVETFKNVMPPQYEKMTTKNLSKYLPLPIDKETFPDRRPTPTYSQAFLGLRKITVDEYSDFWMNPPQNLFRSLSFSKREGVENAVDIDGADANLPGACKAFMDANGFGTGKKVANDLVGLIEECAMLVVGEAKASYKASSDLMMVKVDTEGGMYTEFITSEKQDELVLEIGLTAAELSNPEVIVKTLIGLRPSQKFEHGAFKALEHGKTPKQLRSFGNNSVSAREYLNEVLGKHRYKEDLADSKTEYKMLQEMIDNFVRQLP